MQNIITTKDDSILVEVSGRLMTDEAAGFLKDIEPLMQASKSHITMDLSGLEFISSAGIRCFVMLLKSCEARGNTLTLTNLPEPIRNIFAMTALLDKFGIK